MYKFAKVFISHGRQVLVMKNQTDNEKGEEIPKLSIIFHFDNGEKIDVGVCLPSCDEGWAALGTAFDEVEQNHIDNITKDVKKGMTALEYLEMMSQPVD